MAASIKFKATRSNQVFRRAPEVRKKMAAGLRSKVKPHLIKEFADNVSDWKHKVRFFGKITEKADFVLLFVHPGSKNRDIYGYVTEGTKGPYKIPKAGPGFLAFNLGYSARTQPRGKAHVGSGTATGPSVIGVMQVTHPGIKAREFEAVVAEENETWVIETIEGIWGVILGSL